MAENENNVATIKKVFRNFPVSIFGIYIWQISNCKKKKCEKGKSEINANHSINFKWNRLNQSKKNYKETTKDLEYRREIEPKKKQTIMKWFHIIVMFYYRFGDFWDWCNVCECLMCVNV